MNLTEITTEEQLQALFDRSSVRPQLIFKHSATCPISGRAHGQMQEYLAGTPSREVDYSLIVVQRSRPLSKDVAERLGVRHESPQALLVEGGRAIWNASHFDITVENLASALAGAA